MVVRKGGDGERVQPAGWPDGDPGSQKVSFLQYLGSFFQLLEAASKYEKG